MTLIKVRIALTRDESAGDALAPSLYAMASLTLRPISGDKADGLRKFALFLPTAFLRLYPARQDLLNQSTADL